MAAGLDVTANLDFDGWASEQARRLSGGTIEGIDAAGISRTLMDMVSRRRACALDAARRMLVSLLLSETCPHHLRGGYVAEMVAAAHELSMFISPSICGLLETEYGRLYRASLDSAAEHLRDVGGNPADLPRTSPWEWAEIFGSKGYLPI